MQEKTRTKVLAGVLGSTLLFAGLRPDKKITEPINEANRRYDNALIEKDKEERKEAKMLDAKSQLREWRERSLPPNTRTAMRVYQQYLTDLAEECNLGRIAVTNGTEEGGRTKLAGDIYKAIGVKVEAAGTLADLSRFLYRFKRADLIQRISSLAIESEDIEGDPYLTLNMTAHGMCLSTAAPRSDLFKQSKLTAELDEEAETIKVADPTEFPEEPGFQLRVGDEYVEVTAIADDGTFTIKRGTDDSEPKAHDPSDPAERVQYVPVAADMVDSSYDQFEDFLNTNPFTKPKDKITYEPRISSSKKKELIRGKELNFKVSVASFDPTLGGPVYELVEGPEGMTLDEKGKLKWKPADDAELKDYVAKVNVKQANNNEVDLAQDITITLKVNNQEPTIRVPRDTITAWIGQTTGVDITIEDDEDTDRLTFDISGIEDAYFDSRSGQFKWAPKEDIEPGEYEAVVKVTDRGDKSAEGRIRFVARDDAAKFTKLTSATSRTYVSSDGKTKKRVQDATLRDSINNKTIKLRVGSPVTIADVSGTVKDITTRDLVMTMARGDATGEVTMSLGGENLRDAYNKMQVIEPEPKPEEKEAKGKEDPKSEGETGEEKPDDKKTGEEDKNAEGKSDGEEKKANSNDEKVEASNEEKKDD